MKEAFIDSDVVIDFLTDRRPFSIEAALLFELSQRGDIILYISSLSINNIHYVISKLENKRKAVNLINKLIKLVKILPVDRAIIERALLSDFGDFEDALQNYCAENGNLKAIITRNTKDYNKSTLSIQTPKEYIASK